MLHSSLRPINRHLHSSNLHSSNLSGPARQSKKKKKRPGTDLHEFSINRRENVEENATEASEVSYSTDSSSMNLHYTQILRTNITAKQMDVQGQRKIILSKTLSLPGDMKWEKAIWAILQEHLVFILLPISTQQE